MFLYILRAIGLGLSVAIAANLVTTIWLHRGLTHKAVTYSPSVTMVFRIINWITTGIRPREWVAVHRMHHLYTDTPKDPHSPKQLGWVRVLFTNVALYRRVAKDPKVVNERAREMKPDRLDHLFFDHANMGLAIGIGILVGITTLLGWGPWLGLTAAGFHAVLYLGLSGAVNSICHHFGRRPFKGTSATNVWWVAIFTSGEGYHNNHHAKETNPRLGNRWWQIDFGWYVIWTLSKLKLAKLRLHAVPRTMAA
jgi:stearoyl-CoA desaturase (delta-9 desaturase)